MVALLLFVSVILLALLVHRLALSALGRTLPFEAQTVRAVLGRIRGLTRLGAPLIAAVIVPPVLQLGEPLLGYLRHALSILLIALAGWTVIAVINLLSARTSPRAWDLRCEVREKMIVWLQERHPEALPRVRAEVGPGSIGPGSIGPGPEETIRSGGPAAAPDRLRQPRDLHE